MTSKLEVIDGRMWFWLNKEEYMALEEFLPAVEHYAHERFLEWRHLILDYPHNRFIAAYKEKEDGK